jgi:hypothetical protein
MYNTLTIKDLYEFVKANKSNKTFIGYTDEQILVKIYDTINHGVLYYCTDSSNQISGTVLATIHTDTKILFIDENLAMNKTNLRRFAKRAKEEFPNYRLEWYKNGVHQMPNINKFYAKLSV